MQQGPKYTVILHEIRRQLGLSHAEYAVVEGIGHLSNQARFPWCTVSKDGLADFYGFTTRGLQKIVERMIELGLLERNDRGHLRTTQKWIDATTDGVNEVRGEQSSGMGEKSSPLEVKKVHPDKTQSSQEGGEKSSPNHISLELSLENQHPEWGKIGKQPALPVLGTNQDDQQIATEIVGHFNTVFGTRHGKGAISALTKRSAKKQNSSLLGYWLESYTPEEIKKSITNAKLDSWWADKLTPVILFRKENTQHEPVDYIGKFLNMASAKEYEPLKYIDVWQTAKQLNVPWTDVKDKAENIKKLLETNEFSKFNKGKTPLECLQSWLEIDLSKGRIGHCDELQILELDDMHPTKVAERKRLDEYKKKLQAEGKL